MTKQKPNSFLHQYDRAFMDSKNVIIIGKKPIVVGEIFVCESRGVKLIQYIMVPQ